VVAKIAVAFVLLVGAGLLFNSFVRLNRVDPGFDPENVTAVPLTFGSFVVGTQTSEGGTRQRLLQDILDRVRALPGVELASAAAVVPFSDLGRCCMMNRATTESGPDSAGIVMHPVTPGLFETLRIPMIAGRDLTWTDAGAADNPIVITRTLAERLFGNANPVGESIIIGARQPESYSVVGMVDDPKFWNLAPILIWTCSYRMTR